MNECMIYIYIYKLPEMGGRVLVKYYPIFHPPCRNWRGDRAHTRWWRKSSAPSARDVAQKYGMIISKAGNIEAHIISVIVPKHMQLCLRVKRETHTTSFFHHLLKLKNSHLNKVMNSLHVVQVVVVHIHAKTEEEPGITAVNNLIRAKLETPMRVEVVHCRAKTRSTKYTKLIQSLSRFIYQPKRHA